jgi:hypothetical protein
MDWITIGLSLALLGGIVLLIFALREILTSPAMTDTVRLLWVLLVLFTPVLGALLWFIVGRRHAGSLDRR